MVLVFTHFVIAKVTVLAKHGAIERLPWSPRAVPGQIVVIGVSGKLDFAL